MFPRIAEGCHCGMAGWEERFVEKHFGGAGAVVA